MEDMYEDSAEETNEKESSPIAEWILYMGTPLVFWPILLLADLSDGYEGPDSANLKSFFGACALTLIIFVPLITSLTHEDIYWWHGVLFATLSYIVCAVIFFRTWRR